MKKAISFSCVWICLLIAINSYSQNAGGYQFSASSGSFIPLTAGVNVDDIEDDYAISSTINLGFTFLYEGVSYTQVKAGSDGFLSFNTSASAATTNDLFYGSGRPLVAPLWDDLDGSATGGVSKASYEVSGTTGSQIFTFEWLNWEWDYGSGDPVISFQVKLYEGSNKIEFIYRQESGAVTSADASIGLAGSGSGNFLSLGDVSGNPSISSSSEMDDIDTKPATGQVYTFLPPTCPAPTALGATGITVSSADLYWTGGGASNWNIEYGTTGFTPGSGTGSVINATNDTVSISSLTANTSYDFYVRDSCGAGDVSSWAGPYSFTTLCNTFIPPYLENFASIPVDCWAVADDGNPSTGPVSLGSSLWEEDGFANNGSSGAYKINLYYDEISDWLISPEFDLSSGGPFQVEFDFAIMEWDESTFAGTLGSDDTVQVLITTNSGSTWTALQTWNSTSSVPVGGSHYTLDLSSYSGTVQFAVWATEGSTDDSEDNDIFIDNFQVRAVPACPDPGALGAYNITASSADLYWTGGGASNWNVEYGTTGFTPGSGTMIAATNDTIPLTGLTGNTSYDFYVQDSCGAGDVSSWTGPYSFTTLCNTFIPPYLEDFTSIPVDCWDVADDGDPSTGPASLGSSLWEENGFANNGSSGAYSINLYSDIRSDWLISPEFDLSSGGPFQVELDLAIMEYASSSLAGTLGSDDTVQVLITTNSGSSWTALQTWNSTSSVPVGGSHYTIDLSSYSGTVQFAVWATEGSADDSEDNDISIDNFQVRAVPSCPDPGALGAYNITASSADLYWTGGGASNWNVEYGTTGFTPGSGTMIAATNDTIPLTGLTGNTSYDFYVQDSCGVGNVSAWIGPFGFKTLCGIQSLPYSENFNTDLGCFSITDGGNTSDTWMQISDYNGDNLDGTGFAFVDSDAAGSGTSLNEVMESPIIDASGLSGSLVIEFDQFFDAYITNTDTCFVDVYDGSTWVNIYMAEGTDVGSWSSPDHQFLDATAYANANFKVRLRYVGAYDYYWAIDNFSVKDIPCIDPQNLGAFNIGPYTADLFWSGASNSVSWNLEYDTAGFTPGAGRFTATPANDTTTVSGLTPSTDYEYYVQSNCGTNGTSAWSGPHAFTTTVPCPAPINLSVANITASSADLNWTSLNAASWTVIYGQNGFNPAVAGTNVNVTSLPFTLPGLTDDTDYDFYVFADCGTDGTSDTSIAGSFTTLQLCADPANISVININASSATVTWGNSSDGTDWNIEYGPVGFAQGTGTVISGSHPLQLTGLTDNTCYDVYVQNDCSANSAGTSNWIGPVTFCTPCLTQSLPFLEDFNTQSFGCFTAVNGGADTSTWNVVPAGGTANATGDIDGTPYALVDSDEDGNGIYMREMLVSAPINAGSLTSGALLMLEFDQFFRDIGVEDTGIVEVFDGSAWQEVYRHNSTSDAGAFGTPDHQVIDITAHSNANLQIRFTYDDGNEWAWWWAVDNILVHEVLCPDPVQLGAMNIGPYSVELFWHSYNTGSSWDMEYGPAGFVQGTGTISTVNNDTIPITGLTPETSYDFYVKTNCGTNGVSAWAGPFTFTTPPSCADPVSMGAEALSTSAVLFWQNPSNANSWNVEYGPAGFGQGTGTSPSPVTNDTTTITGLTPGTWYDFYVQADCGTADGTSNWIGPFSFKTTCVTQTLPYVESFNSDLGCFVAVDGGSSTVTWAYEDPSGTALPGGLDGTGFALMFDPSILNSYDEIMTSAPVDASSISGNLVLEFDQLFEGGLLGGAEGVVEVYNGTKWDTVYTINTNVGAASNPDHQFIDISGMANATLQVRFRITDGASWGSGWAVDNFKVRDVLCTPSTGLMASYTDTDSALVNWTPGSGISFMVEYGPAGFSLGGGTTVTTTDTFYGIGGLAPATLYDVYLIDSCTGTYGDTLGPITFQTDCSVQSLPFFEDFNTGFGCFRPVNGGDAPETWFQAPAGGVPTALGDLDGTPYVLVNSDLHGDGIYMREALVSAEIDAGSLTSGSILVLRFDQFFRDIGVDDTGIVQVFDGIAWQEVYRNTATTDVGAFGSPDHQYIDITAYANANLRVRFIYDDGDTWAWWWAVDNVFIGEVSCPRPTAMGAFNITDNSADIFWTTGGASNWDVEYDTAGFTLGSGRYTLSVLNDTTSLSSLLPNTTYEFYVRDSCGPGDVSTWEGPYSFTTLCIPYAAPFTETFDNPVMPGCWDSYQADGDGWRFGGTPGYAAANAGDHTGNGGTFAWIDYSTPDDSTNLETPVIDVSGLTTPSLSFSMYSHNTNSTNPGDYNDMIIEAYDGNNWVRVDSLNGDLGGWADFVYDLSPYVYNTNFVHIRFRGEPGSGIDVYYNDLLIDDVVVDELPTCFPPANLGVFDITDISANMHWTTGGAGSWQYAYGDTAVFDLNTALVTGTLNDTVLLSGLLPGTTYEFYVRDSCSPGDVSAWSGPVIFSTSPCNASLKCNYIFELVDDFGDGWNDGEITVYQSGVPVATLDFPPLLGGEDDTLKVDTIALCQGLPTEVVLSTGGEYPEEIGLNVKDLSGTVLLTYLPAAATTEGDTLGSVTVSCGIVSCVPSGLSVNNLTCSSADLTWTPSATGNISIVAYGSAGFNPETGGTKLSFVSSPQPVTGLTPGTNYEFYVADTCNNDTSAWVGPVAFTTPSGPIAAGFTFVINGFTVDFDASTSVGATSYSWDFGDGNTGTGVNPQHTYTTGGDFDVILTITGPCGTHTDTIPITGVNLAENIISSSLKVYPNPSAGYLNISFKTESSNEAVISILDLSGKLIMQYSENQLNGEYQNTLDISRLAKGTYMLKIESGSISANRRILKQ